MSLEQIVRPFQSVNVFAVGTRPGPSQPVPDAILLEIGKNGSPKTFTGSFSSSMSGYMSTQHKETVRKVQPVDVKNPDDPDQKVRLNSTEQLETTSGRGKNFMRHKRKYNKAAELTDLTDIEKIGPVKTVNNT